MRCLASILALAATMAHAEGFMLGTQADGLWGIDTTGTVEHVHEAYGIPHAWHPFHRDGVSGTYYGLGSMRDTWTQATVNYRPTWQATAGGGLFSFDGVDDVITGTSRGTTGAVSIAFWANMRLSSGTKSAVGDYNETSTNCGIRIDVASASAALFRYRFYGFHNSGNYVVTDGPGSAYLTTGRWHHVVMVFGGQASNNVYLYTNGVAATVTFTHAGAGFVQLPTAVRDPVSIGATDKASSPFYQQHYPGQLDDVRWYYGRTLTNTDAAAIFNQTKGRYGL